ncbi:MAG: ribosome maturation factor RimP [Acidimicrobiales bacterium]
MGTAEAVERAVAPALEDLGYELVDVEARPGLVRVTIDRRTGLDLQAISEATVAVSGALDASDAVPGGRYELEVSSPGVERRLRKPEHYSQAVGAPVAVKLRTGSSDQRRLEGVVREAGIHEVVIEVEGEPEHHRIAYADIERGHTLFDWRAALAADSASRRREPRRSNKPSAAEASRAAVVTRQRQSNRGDSAGDVPTAESPPAHDRDMTETE